MSIPARLYKYEPWSTRAIQNLKAQVIHFGSPRNFNDPFDCSIMPNIPTPDVAETECIRQFYEEQNRSWPVAHLQHDSLSALLLRAATAAMSENIQSFLDSRGVACFSETNNNLLMWSHYGGCYKGFCLEFATTDPAFEKARQVRYSGTRPTVTVSSILTSESFDPVSDLFATKAAPWAYEKEWRVIHSKAGTEFGYEEHSLTGIYFGPNIDPKSLEIICLILAGQNEHIQLWQGKRSDTEFKVEFNQFTYTSFLEARRKGLR